MTLKYYLAYFSIVFIATVTPGPSMLLALNHGANHGIKRTIYSGVGNIFGNLLIAFVSLAGLRAILIASSMAFTLIKWTGVVYLIYIGIKMFFEPVKQTSVSEKTDAPVVSRTTKGLIIDGFVVAIANPKGLVFFTALFPQFINTRDSSLVDFFILFATLGFIAFIGFMLYAFFGTKINRFFHVYSFKKMYNRVVGTIFAGLGVAMAVGEK